MVIALAVSASSQTPAKEDKEMKEKKMEALEGHECTRASVGQKARANEGPTG